MANVLGQMKVSLGQELTLRDCQIVATFEDFPPGVRERMTDGLTLINTLESYGKFSKDDLSYLVTLFTNVSLHRAAEIVKEYQNSLQCPEHPPHQPTIQAGPDLSREHMDEEVPESKLALLADVMGQKGRNFAIAKLKLSTAEIENIEHEEKHLPNVIFKCLNKWRNKKGEEATYGKLVKLIYEYGFPREAWGILETPEED